MPTRLFAMGMESAHRVHRGGLPLPLVVSPGSVGRTVASYPRKDISLVPRAAVTLALDVQAMHILESYTAMRIAPTVLAGIGRCFLPRFSCAWHHDLGLAPEIDQRFQRSFAYEAPAAEDFGRIPETELCMPRGGRTLAAFRRNPKQKLFADIPHGQPSLLGK